MKNYLSGGNRRGRLWSDIDKAYTNFLNSLPEPVRNTGKLKATYSGKPEAGWFDGPSGLNPAIVGGPWLFWDAFSSLSDEQIRPIAVAGSYLGVSSLILDHLYDGQLDQPQTAVALQQALYDQAIHLFREHIDSSAVFWDHLDRLWSELQSSLSTERQLQIRPRLTTVEEFKATASAKAAPVAITVAALAEISNRFNGFEEVEGSLKKCGAVAQLDHDISDWRKDVRNRHMTFFLNWVIDSERMDNGWPTEQEIGKIIDDNSLDVKYLMLARDWCGQALAQAKRLGCQSWIHFIEVGAKHIEANLDRSLIRHIFFPRQYQTLEQL